MTFAVSCCQLTLTCSFPEWRWKDALYGGPHRAETQKHYHNNHFTNKRIRNKLLQVDLLCMFADPLKTAFVQIVDFLSETVIVS